MLKDGKELAPHELPTQAAARSGTSARDVELEIVFDDGTRRTIMGNAEPILDDQGRARGAVSAFIDVTKLSDAVHTRDAFLSMASHELKTPITSLRLQVESLLRAREGVTAPVAKAADATRRQVVRLTALVNTLLDVSRLNESRLQLELEPVDLSALVREVVSRFAAETELSRARIRVDAAAEVSGRWDRLRLEQVLTNLVSNALKYGEGKPISLRVGADGDIARIEVADQGIGIAPGEQGRIFERFERGRATRGYGGFGLGLWITRENHHRARRPDRGGERGGRRRDVSGGASRRRAFQRPGARLILAASRPRLVTLTRPARSRRILPVCAGSRSAPGCVA